MTNKNTYIAVAVVVAVLAVGWVAYSRYGAVKEQAMMEKESMQAPTPTPSNAMEEGAGAMMDKAQTPAPSGEAMMAKKGSYEAYAPEKIARAKDGKVVLFFRASWCPTCRALDADIRANLDKIPGGVTILDVNYDSASALKQKYGVTYQHTLVQVDADGGMIAKWSGSPTLMAMLSEAK